MVAALGDFLPRNLFVCLVKLRQSEAAENLPRLV